MKRILSFLLVIILAFAFFGCDKTEKTPSADPADGTGSYDSAEASTARLPEVEINPLLWKVSDGRGNYIYLFGTIHAGDKRVNDALALVEKYIAECEAVAAEFDILTYQQDVAQMAKDMQVYVLTDGTKIKDHVSPELIDKATEIIKKTGAYSPVYEQMNAAFWVQLLDEAVLMTETALSADYGVDMNILKKCRDEGKEVLELESAAFQYGLLCSRSDRLYEYSIKTIVENIPELRRELESVYTAWLSGDAEMLTDMMSNEGVDDEELQREIAEYNEDLVDNRNKGMFNKARGWLDGGKKAFVTAGAGHMVGEGGLAELFEKAGYTVERIDLKK